VTRLDGVLVRPHDIEVFTTPEPGAVTGKVARIVRLGFEVRVDVAVASGVDSAGSAAEGAGSGGDSGEVWVQLTRGEAERLALSAGDPVWLLAAGQPAVARGGAGALQD
jgi:sulfate transport system ATP-binding protein